MDLKDRYVDLVNGFFVAPCSSIKSLARIRGARDTSQLGTSLCY